MDASYVQVLQAIAVELAKCKRGAAPLVIWAWTSSILGYGDDADGPALHLAVTPGRADSPETMRKLCGPFGVRVAMAEAWALDRHAAPVLAQAPVPGAVCQIVDEHRGALFVRRLWAEQTVTFFPADAFADERGPLWARDVRVLSQRATVGGK